MNTRILFNFTLGLALCVGVSAGCTKSPSLEQVKTYTLVGHSVQFSPPPTTFEFSEARLPEDRPSGGFHLGENLKVTWSAPKAPKTKGPAPIVALIFRSPSKQGHIAVNAIDGIDFDKLDANNMSFVQEDLRKRQGKFTKQHEIDLLGGKNNGYRLEFEYGDGELKMQGVQIHVPYNKVLYSIVMTAPVKEYKDDLPYFEGIVKTFQVQ